MAKSKSFFGLRRGSTKSLTFQVLNGEQITKERVSEVKNPRTDKQMLQRAIFQTIATAASQMREVVDHSFEGIGEGVESLRQFRSLNLALLRAKVAADLAAGVTAEQVGAKLAPKGFKYITPNAYLISTGTQTRPALVPLAIRSDAGVPSLSFAWLGNNGETTKEVDYAPSYTIRDMVRIMLGINPGEQLTYVHIDGSDVDVYVAPGHEYNDPGYVATEDYFYAHRIVLAGEDNPNWDLVIDSVDDFVSFNLASELLRNNLVVADKTDFEFLEQLSSKISISVDSNDAPKQVTFQVSSPGGGIMSDRERAGGFIHSVQQPDGSYKYSRCQLVVAAPDAAVNYGLAPMDAVESWLNTNILADNGLFLDEGGAIGSVGNLA